MNNDTIVEIGEEEAQRILQAKRSYVVLGNIEPPRKTVKFKDYLARYGLEIIFIIVSTIGAALVSATRVGSLMEITQRNLSAAFLRVAQGQEVVNPTTYGMFYWSMLAFEGSLVAAGLSAGRKKSGITISSWGVAMGFLVTISAGFLSSLTLIEGSSGVELFIAIIFALVSGIGGPIIAFFGSENLGFTMKEMQKLQEEWDTEWKERVRVWSMGLQAYYQRSANQIFGVDRKKQRTTSDDQPKPTIDDKDSVMGTVRDYLKQSGILPSQVGKNGIITVARINDELKITNPTTKNNVSVYISGFRNEEIMGKW